MQKIIALSLLLFFSFSCWQQKKADIVFFVTDDFNKSILPQFTIGDLMRSLEQEGLQKNRDFYFSYSHASSEPSSVKEIADYIVKKVDLVVTLGDQASRSVAQLHAKNKNFKVFMVARSMPKAFESNFMTGVFIKNKMSTTELEKILVKNLVMFIKKRNMPLQPSLFL